MMKLSSECMPPNHGYVFALDEKEKAILMQTALLRFFRRNVLGNKIDLPAAGVKTDDIIAKHVHTNLILVCFGSCRSFARSLL